MFLVHSDLRSKDGCMLMNTEGPQSVLGCRHGMKRSIFADVPQLDLTITASTDKLPEASPLHVDISDPLLVFPPHLNHRHGWFQS